MPAERRLRALRGAEAEMNLAADEYDMQRPGLGDDFLDAVHAAVMTLVDAPERWPLVDERHHRFVLKRFPYSVFYRFDETEVIVVAIAHHRRRPGYWARRR